METGTVCRNQEISERADRALMDTYGHRDVAIVRGEGAYVWDADGKRYLDFLAGIATNNLGHCHPAISEAIAKQAGRLLHVSNIVLIEEQVELAEILLSETGMDRAFIANTGTEAAECAIKLARMAGLRKSPERDTIMVFTGSFHGRTFGALSATHEPKYREGFGGMLQGFRFAEFNSLADVDAKWDERICAVMLEPIQGNSGVATASKEFLTGLRERCTRRGVPLVLDEVQCGMGRSGRSFAYQHAGIEPDVLLLAKALGGGIPIGATLARGEYAEVFHKGQHGTTFGGNPLACAVACVAARMLFDFELHEEVGRLGCRLWGHMLEVQKRMPDMIDHMRGKGLMLGLVLNRSALPFPKIALKHGLLITGAGGNVVRLVPPLIVTEDQIDDGARRIEAALRELAETPAT
ncbi:MAG: acetylornithine/succinylornithine family transaminase [Candidatus Sumerlaeia bacterium]|nr:acetylornithine/succinylornithine family transaminase [Candidatus Sumerlaeia bacterium]